MLRLAAPSCVIPDRLGPNCLALAPVVREVGLMLLETRSCLGYDDQDLPPYLHKLGLNYHAHLPLDLPWEQGVPAVDEALGALERKIAFVHPWGYVLHPPQPHDLEHLLGLRPDLKNMLCLENIKNHDLSAQWPVIKAHNLGVCLDLGHLVSYNQDRLLLQSDFFAHLKIMHVYGGESARGHAGLDHLPNPDLLRQILQQLTRSCTLVVEVFDMHELRRSLALLRSWLDAWGMNYD